MIRDPRRCLCMFENRIFLLIGLPLRLISISYGVCVARCGFRNGQYSSSWCVHLTLFDMVCASTSIISSTHHTRVSVYQRIEVLYLIQRISLSKVE